MNQQLNGHDAKLQIVLIRPGATDFDEQGRIKGTLDIPLSISGAEQVTRTIEELANISIDAVYCAPGESAQQTAAALAASRGLKVTRLDTLRNLDHGLWQGKLIDEVKQRQPKIYRQWQDRPETTCPPQGESLDDARKRVRPALQKLLKKHKQGVVALVIPDPLASMVRCLFDQGELGDLWKAACDSCRWELIDIVPERVAAE
jgi:probable phosphoglycerate mutase